MESYFYFPCIVIFYYYSVQFEKNFHNYLKQFQCDCDREFFYIDFDVFIMFKNRKSQKKLFFQQK